MKNSKSKTLKHPSSITDRNNKNQQKCSHLAKNRSHANSVISETSHGKRAQLFSMIQTFHISLSKLSLEQLISSSQPHLWLAEQTETLLSKIPKQSEFDFYNSKLKAVEVILSNISNNLTMLSKIEILEDQSSATNSNYDSRATNSNYNSRASQNTDKSALVKNQMLKYDHYEISKNSSTSRSQWQPEIMAAKTIHSEDQEENSINSEAIYQRQLQKLHKNLKQSDINIDQLLKKTKRNYGNTNDYENDPNFGNLSSNYTKDKTISKDNILRPISSQITLLPSREKLENDTEQGTLYFESVKQSREMQLQQMIQDLSLQLKEKDNQVENLLMTQLSYQQAIEFHKQQSKQKDMQILFQKQLIQNLSKEKQNLKRQISKDKDYKEQLRDTIRFQRERNRKQTKEKQIMESKYQDFIEQNAFMKEQIEKLQTQTIKIRKNQELIKQKFEIYSRKYFQIMNEKDKICKDNQKLLKKIENLSKYQEPSKIEQLQAIIQHHKNQLNKTS